MRMLSLIMGEKYNNPLDKKIKVFLTKDSIAEFVGSGLEYSDSDVGASGGQLSYFGTIVKLPYSSYMRDEGDLTEMKGSMASFPRRRFDYVIANHAEIDHSGALPELMKHIPDTPVYCTNNGVRSLKGHFHEDWDFHPVKTGDKLDLGGKELIFVEAPMLHWPDSMMCYLTQDNILFSNDAFRPKSGCPLK